MMAGYKGMVRFTLFYAIITTVIMVFRTEIIRTDYNGLIHIIGRGFMTVFDWSKIAELLVARLGDMIPYTTVSLAVDWVLLIIVCVGSIGGLGLSVVVLGKKICMLF